MKNFEIIPGIGYEINPEDAEELGAFEEDAIEKEDAVEAIEEES